jgi:hypothetical protein
VDDACYDLFDSGVNYVNVRCENWREFRNSKGELSDIAIVPVEGGENGHLFICIGSQLGNSDNERVLDEEELQTRRQLFEENYGLVKGDYARFLEVIPTTHNPFDASNDCYAAQGIRIEDDDCFEARFKRAYTNAVKFLVEVDKISRE